MRGEEVIEYPANQKTLTQRYTEESIKFIRQNKDRPFFLYLPHTMVHLPLAVSQAFENRTDRLIWDAIEEVDWSVGEVLNSIKSLQIDQKNQKWENMQWIISYFDYPSLLFSEIFKSILRQIQKNAKKMILFF